SQLVYPMRATALATSALPVTIYVLADHRTNKTMTFGLSRVTYADWLEPSTLPADSPLRAFVQGRQFLTKFEDVVNPTQVDDDFVYTFAAQDVPFHEVIVHHQDDYTLFYALVCGVPLLFGLLLTAGIVHYLRRRRATAPAA
ncbi:MAG TPA: hypothetical protein PKE45_09985, partial [Caldilineaceae bacterium]|nr:hypothetical protein [Caldilineaceae bacterium]